MVINVDTKAVRRYTAELHKMHRSNFPIAVRETLNKAAFDLKKNTLQKSASKEFINRSPNFFKAYSKADKATGFNISSMKSTVGFTEKGLKGEDNYAVRDLVAQEFGGTLGGKSFIPMRQARAGNSDSKQVKTINRIGNLGNIVKSKNIKSRKTKSGTSVPVKSQKEAFTIAAIKAGEGGLVMGNLMPKVLYRVNKLIRKGGSTIVASAPLYTVQKRRRVPIKATGFVKEAAEITGDKLQRYYIEEAKRRFAKGRKL